MLEMSFKVLYHIIIKNKIISQPTDNLYIYQLNYNTPGEQSVTINNQPSKI